MMLRILVVRPRARRLVPEHPCSLDHRRFQAVLASVCLAPSCASAATSLAAVPAALTFATLGASQTRACSARASTQFGPLRSLPLLICANGARHQQLQRLLALHLCAHLLKTCDFRILHLCIVASSRLHLGGAGRKVVATTLLQRHGLRPQRLKPLQRTSWNFGLVLSGT